MPRMRSVLLGLAMLTMLPGLFGVWSLLELPIEVAKTVRFSERSENLGAISAPSDVAEVLSGRRASALRLISELRQTGADGAVYSMIPLVLAVAATALSPTGAWLAVRVVYPLVMVELLWIGMHFLALSRLPEAAAAASSTVPSDSATLTLELERTHSIADPLTVALTALAMGGLLLFAAFNGFRGLLRQRLDECGPRIRPYRLMGVILGCSVLGILGHWTDGRQLLEKNRGIENESRALLQELRELEPITSEVEAFKAARRRLYEQVDLHNQAVQPRLPLPWLLEATRRVRPEGLAIRSLGWDGVKWVVEGRASEAGQIEKFRADLQEELEAAESPIVTGSGDAFVIYVSAASVSKAAGDDDAEEVEEKDGRS